MSDASIPESNGNLKPYGAGYTHLLACIANLMPRETLQQLASALVPPPKPTPPQGRPPRKSGLYTVLQSAQEHGITHPTKGGYLQLPREFDAILALEHKAVAQVVLEVLRQTIGTPVRDEHGNSTRKEWAEISTRDFVRAGLTTQKAAWRGIKVGERLREPNWRLTLLTRRSMPSNNANYLLSCCFTATEHL
jgi:hypothetical protein